MAFSGWEGVGYWLLAIGYSGRVYTGAGLALSMRMRFLSEVVMIIDEMMVIMVWVMRYVFFFLSFFSRRL